ncbi:MAG: hypothetical protein AAFZ65_18175, partial [Planctomycetota bacterium]
HPSTVGGFWLNAGEEREVELVLGEGGTVVGRVVDDLGRGIGGVEIRRSPFAVAERVERQSPLSLIHLVRGELGRTMDTLATTDGSGRFAIPHLLSEPRTVWIDNAGQARPETIEPLRFTLARQLDAGWILGETFEAHGEEGARTDVGQFLIARSARIRGQVRFESGGPVPGALVRLLGPAYGSATQGLRLEAFRPGRFDERVVTRADGSFEIAVPGELAGRSLAVYWTDRRQLDRQVSVRRVDLPAVRPAELLEGVTVELPDAVPIEITLRTPDGRPWQPAPESNPPPLRRTTSDRVILRRVEWTGRGRTGMRTATSGAEAAWIELPDDSFLGALGRGDVFLDPDSEGVARTWMPVGESVPSSVYVCADNHRAVETALEPDGRGGFAATVTLTPRERRVVRFVDEVGERRGRLPSWIALWHGKQSSDRRRSAPLHLHPLLLPHEVSLVGDPQDIGTLSFSWGREEEQTFATVDDLGPPGSVIEIRMPPVGGPRQVTKPRPAEELPTLTSEREERARQASVFVAVEGPDGVPLAEARLVVYPESALEAPARAFADDYGRISADVDAPQTSARAVVRERDHVSAEFDLDAFAPGERIDLGEVRLEARPTFELTVQQDSEPRITRLRIFGLGWFDVGDEPLTLPVPEDLGRLQVVVRTDWGNGLQGHQWHTLPLPSAGDRVVLEVDPWVQV